MLNAQKFNNANNRIIGVKYPDYLDMSKNKFSVNIEMKKHV